MARSTATRWTALVIIVIGVPVVLAVGRWLGGITGEAGQTADHDGADTARAAAFDCPVTEPNGSTPPGESPSPGHHGNGAIWTVLWPEGVVVFEPGGPGAIGADGTLSMKWPWWRSVPGAFEIEGRRLDEPSDSVLRADILDGYGETGFQATALIFPGEGCWEVTARAGKESLSFVTAAKVVGKDD